MGFATLHPQQQQQLLMNSALVTVPLLLLPPDTAIITTVSFNNFKDFNLNSSSRCHMKSTTMEKGTYTHIYIYVISISIYLFNMIIKIHYQSIRCIYCNMTSD